jgi:guanylate kinase
MTTQKTKTLLIMGTSGAGKSVLKDTLVSKYSKVFNNVTQVSTRQPRSPDDKSYDFITVEKYKEIEDTLLCKTDIHYYCHIFKVSGT